jgi:putative FmdB family regulatory protein
MSRLCGIYKWGPARAFANSRRKEEYEMPTYSFQCKKCGRKFQEILSFREYEERKRKCPKCGSKSVAQLLDGFTAKTSKKS